MKPAATQPTFLEIYGRDCRNFPSMSRKPATVEFWRGHLPHWEVSDALHFVTIHLAGAIPVSRARQTHALSKELTRGIS